MSQANLPVGFYANVIRCAFPESHCYKVALFEKPQTFSMYSSDGECEDVGYTTGGKELTGYTLVDNGSFASLKFNTSYDWFDITVRTQCAVIYDADTGVVLNIMDFGRPCGVINGVFTVTLHADGVVQMGDSDEAGHD